MVLKVTTNLSIAAPRSELRIKSSRSTYTVEIGVDVAAFLRTQLRAEDAVFVDSNVLLLHPWIKECIGIDRIVSLDVSEDLKSLKGVSMILDMLQTKGVTRSARLVAIGGGVVQDALSFAASILFRGVEWVFIPTTLLAQSDSCIGSKTSINHGNQKNQLGTFFPPTKICIDARFLETLPDEQIRSGVGEMFHYFLVSGEGDFEFAKLELDSALSDRSNMCPLIEKSLVIKKAMVEIDEFDCGPRRIFNYGHSFGHALEAATNFAIPHGIAVSIGMDLANYLSADRELVTMGFRNKIQRTLRKIWMSRTLNGVNQSKFFEALMKDKKNEGGNVKVILTRGFGEMFLTTLEINPSLRTLVSEYFKDNLHQREL